MPIPAPSSYLMRQKSVFKAVSCSRGFSLARFQKKNFLAICRVARWSKKPTFASKKPTVHNILFKKAQNLNFGLLLHFYQQIGPTCVKKRARDVNEPPFSKLNQTELLNSVTRFLNPIKRDFLSKSAKKERQPTMSIFHYIFARFRVGLVLTIFEKNIFSKNI